MASRKPVVAMLTMLVLVPYLNTIAQPDIVVCNLSSTLNSLGSARLALLVAVGMLHELLLTPCRTNTAPAILCSPVIQVERRLSPQP